MEYNPAVWTTQDAALATGRSTVRKRAQCRAPFRCLVPTLADLDVTNNKMFNALVHCGAVRSTA
jgi:hypothetical protein